MRMSYQCAGQQPPRQCGADMGDIVDLNKVMPHMIITDYNNDAHVLSLSMVRDIANNRYSPSATDGRLLAIALLDFIDD